MDEFDYSGDKKPQPKPRNRKVKKEDDKRAQTSRDNLARARQAKLQKLSMQRQSKQAVKNSQTYELPESSDSSSSSNDESDSSSSSEEIVIKSRNKKASSAKPKKGKGDKTKQLGELERTQQYQQPVNHDDSLRREIDNLKYQLMKRKSKHKSKKEPKSKKVVQIINQPPTHELKEPPKNQDMDFFKRMLLTQIK